MGSGPIEKPLCKTSPQKILPYVENAFRNFDLIINEHAYQKTIPKKLKNKTTEIKKFNLN